MKIRYKPQEQEYDYFAIFGLPSEDGDCFIHKQSMDHHIGKIDNTFYNIIDAAYFIFIKILPRIIIPIGIVYLTESLLTFNGQIVAYIIIVIALFIKFPPAIETLYLINKYDNQDDTFVRLLELSKDQSVGICVFRKSFVLKDYSKLGLERTINNLLKYINLNNYEVTFHHKDKKELEEHFNMLSRRKPRW